MHTCEGIISIRNGATVRRETEREWLCVRVVLRERESYYYGVCVNEHTVIPAIFSTCYYQRVCMPQDAIMVAKSGEGNAVLAMQCLGEKTGAVAHCTVRNNDCA